MNGMKIPLAIIFAVAVQAIGLVWYVSKIDSKERYPLIFFDSLLFIVKNVFACFSISET